MTGGTGISATKLENETDELKRESRRHRGMRGVRVRVLQGHADVCDVPILASATARRSPH